MKTSKLFLLGLLLISGLNLQAQITVNSLDDLKQYLDDDNVNVVLAPGEYTITGDDVSSGGIGKYWEGANNGDILGNSFNVFLFEGDNSIYDFTGVTIYIKTETAQVVGNLDFYEVRTIGSNNIIKNLTVIDDGSVDDAPRRRATNVILDGANNTIDNCTFTVKGSYPYGYGDIFGKSGTNVIGHNKRSACCIRGKSNLLKNSTFYCRSYGHGIFFQGAEDPQVDGCYVEGEIRSTDEVLAEEGTGSPADNVDFLTIMGFNLRDLEGNYYFSLQEDGIRSYNAGETVIDGVEYDRGVTNATVKNSTVVKMRSGVTIGWAAGIKKVENCTTLACETGYWVGGDTEVINCKGDASIGSLLSEDVGRRNATIELTLLDDYVTPLSGEVTGLYYAGEGHDVILHDATTSTLDHFEIVIGGERLAHRFMTGNGSTNEPLHYDAEDITFINNSYYPIYVGDVAEDIDITTCGTVTDVGLRTSITYKTDCQKVDGVGPICNNTATLIEAECYDDMFGLQTEASDDGTDNIGDIQNGDWAVYNGIDLSDVYSVKARLATVKEGISIEVRLDALEGELLATIPVTNTGAWQTWGTNQENIGVVDGIHDVYFVFTGGGGGILNANWFGFSEDIVCKNTVNHIEAECYDDMSGIQTQGASEGTLNVGWVNNGDWASYKNIDLSNMNSIKARVSSKISGSTIEVRLDAIDGDLIAEIPVTNTGGNQDWVTDSVNIEATDGVHDIYLVFTGGESFLFNINDFGFSEEKNVVTSIYNSRSTAELEIKPNPVVNEFRVLGRAGASLELYSTTGHILIEKRIISNNDQFDVSHLQKGIYVVRVIDGESINVSQIIKE